MKQRNAIVRIAPAFVNVRMIVWIAAMTIAVNVNAVVKISTHGKAKYFPVIF